MCGVVGPGEQPPLLQPAENEVHRLPGDEGAAGELGVGQPGTLPEQFEARVLGNAQTERPQHLVHRGVQRGLHLLDDVAHRPVQIADGLPLLHVSILTYPQMSES